MLLNEGINLGDISKTETWVKHSALIDKREYYRKGVNVSTKTNHKVYYIALVGDGSEYPLTYKMAKRYGLDVERIKAAAKANGIYTAD